MNILEFIAIGKYLTHQFHLIIKVTQTSMLDASLLAQVHGRSPTETLEKGLASILPFLHALDVRLKLSLNELVSIVDLGFLTTFLSIFHPF